MRIYNANKKMFQNYANSQRYVGENVTLKLALIVKFNKKSNFKDVKHRNLNLNCMYIILSMSIEANINYHLLYSVITRESNIF